MDAFQNPQQFENSSIVQKSSKTGIFSNKRLLVIKAGYLYYFSKVPKGYKSHVPNILTTFTDLPKSSIEIKNILEIRLQSAKSSSLIIKFYLKDMIDRQDIRKSIDSQLYSMPNKKPNLQTDEWKFMFTTVLQCRLWYNALMKLKDYFKNLEHKFSDFVANFDPKRNSVTVNNSDGKDFRSQSDLKSVVGSSNVIGSSSNNVDSKSSFQQIKRNTQPAIKFDASKFITPLIQNQSSDSSQTSSHLNTKEQTSPIKQTTLSLKEQQQQKPLKQSNITSQQGEGQQDGSYHPNISHKIQPQIPQHHIQHIKKGQSFKSTLKESHLIQPIDEEDQFRMKQMQDDIREEVKEEIERKIKEQVEQKLRQKLEREKQQEIKKYQAEVHVKQMKIKQLQTQIHINHLANMEKQKKIEQQKKLLQNKIFEEQQKLNHAKVDFQRQLKQVKLKEIENNSISQKKPESKESSSLKDQWKNQDQQYDESNRQSSSSSQYQTSIKPTTHNITTPTSNQILVHEFSVQTDYQEFHYQDSFEPHFNFSKDISLQKQLNLSKQTKIRNSFFSDVGLGSHRNTLITDRLKIENDIKEGKESVMEAQFGQGKFNYFAEMAKVFQQGVPANQRMKKQTKLLNYINFVKQKVVSIVDKYIDKNRPTKCTSFEKGIFSFQIACASGKTMNIGEEPKLIYSNKVHQNLKRTFKVYQHLHTEIMKVLKTRPSYPVRVPLCTLVEYKGYTVLARQQICTNEIDLPTKEKYLKHILSPTYYSVIQLSKTVNSTSNQVQFYFVKVLKPFKITNEQKNSQIFKNPNDFCLLVKEIQNSRKNGVSICYEKLVKEYQECKQDNETDSQQNENGLFLLKTVKLMRELKKVFKSMQPFQVGEDIDKEQQQISQQKIKKAKSKFIQVLLSNPQKLISLIPSETDYSQFDIRSGYFCSLLYFFLGIRINQPINKNARQANISYDIISVSRTFCLPSLIIHQYEQKLTKSLTQNNLLSASNCLNLIKPKFPKSISTLFYEIKLLLKQKQYCLAEDKIQILREMLPIHDLRNIELNAYLIECYIFMGLQTDALKEIKTSLQYVQYLFGDKKNMYQLNLHLLMAETMLRMGNVNESIQLYKSLLKQNKIQKQVILISFGQTLISDPRIQPNQIIPFLLQCVEDMNQSQKKIELMICVAKLYLRTQRKDKFVYFLQKSFQLCLGQKLYYHLLQIYQLLMNETPDQIKRHTIFENFMSKVDPKYWLNNQNNKNFNTINLYHRLNQANKQDNQQIVEILTQMSNKSSVLSSCSKLEVNSWDRVGYLANVILEGREENRMKSQEELKSLTQLLQTVNLEALINMLSK